MIGCIIQARLGSSRLPGKVLMNIDQKFKVIDYVINQTKFSKYIDDIVVATSINENDCKIVNYLSHTKIKIFRGNETDVLDRYYQCAKKHSFKNIVRITSDNPLIDPRLIDKVIKHYNENFDYSTNTLPRTFPYGTEVEIFSFKTLEKAWKESKLTSEREHVTPYIRKNPEIFKIFNLENNVNLSNLRWTIDRINDLELVKKICKELPNRPIFTEDILKLLKNNPDFKKINDMYMPDEGYQKSLEVDKNFKCNKKK